MDQILTSCINKCSHRISNPTVTGSNPVGVANPFKDLRVMGDQDSFASAEKMRNKNAFGPSVNFEVLLNECGHKDQQLGLNGIWVRK